MAIAKAGALKPCVIVWNYSIISIYYCWNIVRKH